MAAQHGRMVADMTASRPARPRRRGRFPIGTRPRAAAVVSDRGRPPDPRGRGRYGTGVSEIELSGRTAPRRSNPTWAALVTSMFSAPTVALAPSPMWRGP